MSVREEVLRARKALLNGGGKLSYFEDRGLTKDTIAQAFVGYEPEVYFSENNGRGYKGPAFVYPCVGDDKVLGVHYKSEERNDKRKRRQKWGGYANDLPRKGHGKHPDAPAKIIPFGLETLTDLEAGSLVMLCCGEEDALSLRQIGFTALSQPGAGLLEPVYARELAGFKVVVFYDAGEEGEARKDALTLREAGADDVRVTEWPPEASNGADVNGRLMEAPKRFEAWASEMIAEAKPVALATKSGPPRSGEPDTYATSISELPAWPVLGEDALYGLPGEIVRTIEPHTEADAVAVLANLLGAVGNALGRGAHVRVGADRHRPNFDVTLVGETAKGRKGMSWGHVRDLVHAVDKSWAEDRVLSGLSSGEGLIHAVRDKVVRPDKNGDPIVVDEGVEDKRLLVMEGEFAQVLKVMSREGNTLSPIIRQAWDGGRLQVMTRNNPMKATDAHISIIGHVTRAELLRHLTQTETANGFANRFMFLMVRRSKPLPFGGEWNKVDTAPLVKKLRSVLEFGEKAEQIGWGESAKEHWKEVYGPLSEGQPGLFGAVIGRAEAQVVRLAVIYAVMDLSRTIEIEHLQAALAFWKYAEESARYIFGDATGDPVADQILEALRDAGGSGMSRTEIRDLFGRHKSGERIDQALALLLKAGRVRREVERTGGRPVERWFAR